MERVDEQCEFCYEGVCATFVQIAALFFGGMRTSSVQQGFPLGHFGASHARAELLQQLRAVSVATSSINAALNAPALAASFWYLVYPENSEFCAQCTRVSKSYGPAAFTSCFSPVCLQFSTSHRHSNRLVRNNFAFSLLSRMKVFNDSTST
jgi:hypothetical protein